MYRPRRERWILPASRQCHLGDAVVVPIGVVCPTLTQVHLWHLHLPALVASKCLQHLARVHWSPLAPGSGGRPVSGIKDCAVERNRVLRHEECDRVLQHEECDRVS